MIAFIRRQSPTFLPKPGQRMETAEHLAQIKASSQATDYAEDLGRRARRLPEDERPTYFRGELDRVPEDQRLAVIDKLEYEGHVKAKELSLTSQERVGLLFYRKAVAEVGKAQTDDERDQAYAHVETIRDSFGQSITAQELLSAIASHTYATSGHDAAGREHVRGEPHAGSEELVTLLSQEYERRTGHPPTQDELTNEHLRIRETVHETHKARRGGSPRLSAVSRQSS